jgi:uncharacterized protein YdaU (DUF1376 family)
MKSAPAFQWYPKDCDTDENVRAMDDREFGFYMRCLNHSWTNDGLPGDAAEIGRVLGRPTAYVKKMWGRVGKCFVLTPDGRYRNERIEAQRAAHAEFRQSRRNAAAKRWHKQVESTCNAQADARALQVECSAFSNLHTAYSTLHDKNTHIDESVFEPGGDGTLSPSDPEDSDAVTGVSVKTVTRIDGPTFLKSIGWQGGWKFLRKASPEQIAAIQKLKPAQLVMDESLDSLCMILARLEWFDEFWMGYWRGAGKKAARIAFFEHVRTLEMHDRVIAAVSEQYKGMMARPEDKRPHASTWLNNERWEDNAAEDSDREEGDLWGAFSATQHNGMHDSGCV